MMNDSIKFRPVAGFDGYYVTDTGKVFSCRKGKTQELQPFDDTYGYHKVTLYRRGRAKGMTISVHRIVAEAFMGPRPEGMQVCHNNGMRTDNRLSNLRYDTPKGNQADRVVHGTTIRGEQSPHAKLVTAQVLEIIQQCEQGATQASVADAYGVSPSLVSQIAHGHRWPHLQRKAA